ncbi:hypothetical protein BY996DRAFT_7586031, partial [Phakopsora pachyrhizi]
HFSNFHCQGKVVSILEGGYSNQTFAGSSLSYNILGMLISLCKKMSQMRSNCSVSSNKMNQKLIDDENLEWTSKTKRIFENIDSYEYLRSEKKQMKQEEKLLIYSTPSDGALRRHQRHASNTSLVTGKTDPNAHSPSNWVGKSEKNHLACFILDELRNQKPTENYPARLEMLQSITAYLKTKKQLLTEPVSGLSSNDSNKVNHVVVQGWTRLKLTYKAGGIFGPYHANNASLDNSTSATNEQKSDMEQMEYSTK